MNQIELFFPRVAATALPITVRPHFPEPAVPLATPEVRFTFVFDGIDVDASASYTVRLADCPRPKADAAAAELRFRRELDRQLGSDVPEAFRAFEHASESSESELSKAEIALAKRWAKAYDAARAAGFRDMGDADEAFFDIRLV